jgi:hypothetical protein
MFLLSPKNRNALGRLRPLELFVTDWRRRHLGLRFRQCATGGSIRTRRSATRLTAAISGPPKRKANGARNPFYETMREVSPGDLILSFVDTRIAAIGIAVSYCYESPKPLEFGEAGAYWNNVGWRARVNFQKLQN